jgi:hypothetical protein
MHEILYRGPLFPLPHFNPAASRAGLSSQLRPLIARSSLDGIPLDPSSGPTLYPNGREADSRRQEIPTTSHRGYIQVGGVGVLGARKKQGDRGVASTTSNWSGSLDASPSRGAAAATNQTRRTPPCAFPGMMVYLAVMACLGRDDSQVS